MFSSPLVLLVCWATSSGVASRSRARISMVLRRLSGRLRRSSSRADSGVIGLTGVSLGTGLFSS